MLQITNVKVYDLEESMHASRYSMMTVNDSMFEPEKDLQRAKKLSKCGGGSGHTNFRKGILVAFDIKYPQYWTIEAQRYGHFNIVSSSSKMHSLLRMDLKKSCNEYVDERAINLLQSLIDVYNSSENYDDRHDSWMRLISNVPMGLELFMRVTTNYEQLATIYKQRRNHVLEDWQVFCDWIETLPYFDELIKESD